MFREIEPQLKRLYPATFEYNDREGNVKQLPLFGELVEAAFYYSDQAESDESLPKQTPKFAPGANGAIIVGTLVSFNSLAADYNRPFRGAFKIESETVTASLRQLRETLSPYCDVNGCVVPESADESSGFGGIISPPWWDDFQEP